MLRARRRILNLFGFPGDFSLDARPAAPETSRCRKVGTQYMNAQSRLDRRLDVDSTQTMRALSEAELYDSHQQRWFAIQLVISDRPINLDMMPRLEAFAAHQLYALVAKHETGTWHALRLGFFPDERSAEATREHLRTYFSEPTTVRVSVAEQTRFAPSVPAPARAAPMVPAAAPAAQRPTVAAAPVEETGWQTTSSKDKTLAQELLEEARELQRSRNGKTRAPQQSKSWITRLFGQPSKQPRAAGRR
jgi:hypothetical protein